MEIRPYQHEFIEATLSALIDVDRVLAVAPTGSGKTVMGGEIIRRANCRSLFLADAQELVRQAADKLGKWAGIIADVEMGDQSASPYSRLVVATTQSIARRLDKYPPDAFGIIIVDEAHRNTLGAALDQALSHEDPVTRARAAHALAHGSGSAHTNRDRLAVKHVVIRRLDGMAQGMAKVQESADSGFALILLHHCRLQGNVAPDCVGDRRLC
mgnify:CR=1 FL=1